MWNNSHYKQRFENAHKMRAQQSGIAAKVKVIFFSSWRQSFKSIILNLELQCLWSDIHHHQRFGNPQEKSTHTKVNSYLAPRGGSALSRQGHARCTPEIAPKAIPGPRTPPFLYIFLCCIFIWQQKTKPECFELKPQHGQQRCIIGVARTLLDHAIAQAEELLAEADHIFNFKMFKILKKIEHLFFISL